MHQLSIGLVVTAVTGCGFGAPSPLSIHSAVDSLIHSSAASYAVGVDVWEVVLCRIPEDHDENLYDMSGVRLADAAQRITASLKGVSEFFERWSNGRYSLEFDASIFEATPHFGGSNECVEEALEHGSADADGVLVIADAQHRDDRGGGWGRAGFHCSTTCAPSESRRAVYLGAADFVSDAMIPLDLVEHELGHALGWPHSRRHSEYDSPFDVMSDSAAPRRQDASRLHAPGVLAINRYLAGWLEQEPMVLDARKPATMEIDEEKFALVVVSPTAAITVEVIAAFEDNAHLDRSGVVVHLIEWGSDSCLHPFVVEGLSGRLCGGTARSQRLIAPETSTDGMLVAGDRVEVAGVEIVVEGVSQHQGSFTATIRSRPS